MRLNNSGTASRAQPSVYGIVTVLLSGGCIIPFVRVPCLIFQPLASGEVLTIASVEGFIALASVEGFASLAFEEVLVPLASEEDF